MRCDEAAAGFQVRTGAVLTAISNPVTLASRSQMDQYVNLHWHGILRWPCFAAGYGAITRQPIAAKVRKTATEVARLDMSSTSDREVLG